MKTPVIYRLVILSLMTALPLFSLAADKYSGRETDILMLDSIRVKPQDKKQDQKPEDKKSAGKRPTDKKPEVDRPDIKEVPRSRRLPKPTAVTERVKRPPVKVVRPGVIKRH